MKYIVSLVLLAILALASPTPVAEKRQAATCGIPSGFSLTVNAGLPDPFTSINGTKITTKNQWPCRAQEINALFQKYELGTVPPNPSSVSATFSSNTLSVTVSDQGKSISFSATITYPSGGTKPYPLLIGIGGVSIPLPANIATMTFDNDGMAAQQDPSSHGTGLFFDLYGKSINTGALAAWGWGVSRIIDALELTPSAYIDLAHIGVTGCSRNGKGAFIVGALEPRIALTIPQESGSGGAACWRISGSEKAAGKNIQTLSEIVTENAWFSPDLNQYANKATSLPHDHHMLAALTVPRGLFVIENDIDWLGPVSTTGCMEIGQKIYQAYGTPEAFGFSLVGGHGHCQFPSAQQSDLTAYINKYLLGSTSALTQVQKSSASATLSNYYSWTVPSLS